MRLWKSFLLPLLLLAATALPAQQTPSNERGFSPEKVFQVGDLDHVNLLNGNVIVNIPIGPAYPVGGALSYQLQLAYNAKVWDYQQATYNNESYREALPDRLSNAGMGWSVSLGRLLEPDDPENDTDTPMWVYVGGDGGFHILYSTLHEGENDFDSFADENQYTRDGSYLRMRRLSSTLRIVEFPDGTVQSFAPHNGRWRLTQIRDRFFNAVNITYSADEKTWTLTDTSDPVNPRTHRIIFSSIVWPYYDKVLDRIELAGFNGLTSTYSFGYILPTYPKPCTHTLPIRTTVAVPVLSTIGLPNGTSYSLEYQATTDPINCEGPGAITKLTLPTRGRLEWTYQTYGMPGDGCSVDGDYYDRSHGVATRRFVDAAGTETGRWTYTPTASAQPGDPGGHICPTSQPFTQFWWPAEEELKNTVVTPLKDKQVYYFSIHNRSWPSEHGFSGYEHGLPFTRFQADSTGTRFLSSQTYDCDAAGNNCVLQRSHYVRYERDAVTPICTIDDILTSECSDTNRRLASSRTVYHDDANRFADTNYSDFDGVGHYRVMATDGNFASGNVRSTEKTYNPGRGRFEINPATNQPTANHTYNQVYPADPWIFETWTSEKVTEGANVSYAETCFEATTGFLQRRRSFKGNGTAQGANDVLAVYQRDSLGNLTHEQLYGGDLQSLATGVATCAMALPATTQYWASHEYQYGVRRSSQHKDASGNAAGTLAFKTLDADIDKYTGLPSVSRDAAGIATLYSYDILGRMIEAKPQSNPGAAWTQYTYFNAAAGLPPRVEVRRCLPNQTPCSPVSQEQFEYDSFGRLAKEKTLLPDNTWNKRVTTYDAAGNKATVSEVQADTTPDANLKKTTYSGYDPYGRPGTVTPPDGASHNITYSYAGVRTQTRNVKIGTGALDINGNIPETTVGVTEVYDRQGRLWRVNELSSPTGTSVTTEYTYDEGNRIGVVKTTAPEGTQFRYFDYDGIGRLTSETHPEKNNVQIRYQNIDAMGKVGRLLDTNAGPNDLTYTYDRAGRLTQVKETGVAGRVLKTFTYADAATACGSCNGRIHKATRYNYVTIGATPYTAVITETYTYGGPLGAVTQRVTQTRVNGNTTGEDFTQTFAYNAQGRVNSVGYPQCTFADCTADGAAAPRTQAQNYTNGWLTRTPGFVDTNITYHANGLYNQIVHSNGVTDVQAIDTTNWLARPLSISTTGALTNWNSGTYKYDGAANVTKIGSDWYRYDKVSRLLETSVTGKLQSYTYDTFGNINGISTTVGGSSVIRATPTTWSTNRLTSGTYDAAGNLTNWNGATYNYDRLNKMWRMQNGAEEWIYLYTADDERIWSFKVGGNLSRWTLRNLSNQVLREYENNAGFWTVVKDYIYRGDELLASVGGGQTLHFHVDHLGTPRLITNAAKQQVAFHAYYAFGEEATAFNQDAERMKFTGHERDLASLAGPGDDLDFMHARFYSPLTARFLSVDPVGGTASEPQSWNRYAYARNNPLSLTDPTGMQSEQKTKSFVDDLFEGLRSRIEGFFNRINPPQRAPEDDPNVQALLDPDVGGNPNILPRNQVGIVQQGMNKAAAITTAGVITVGAVVASDGALNRIMGLLRPAGRLLGMRGSREAIREVPGGVSAARKMFAELTHGGRVIENARYPGTLVEVEGVGTIGLREASKSGPPTIDVFVRGFEEVRKIKFLD